MNSSILGKWMCHSLTSTTAILAALLLTPATQASDYNRPTHLDTQVVSATGQRVVADDSVIRTEVITSQQLESMQAKVLTDALRYAPGLKLQRTVKTGTSINIQGADSNHVLVLRDGLPFISPSRSETDISQIPLVGIERIEIIKGAGSALYGSSAMGGVINLISKEVEGNSLELDISAGRYHEYADDTEWKKSLAASSQYKDTKLSVQVFRNNSPEIDLNPKTLSVNGAEQTLETTELRLDQKLFGKKFFLRGIKTEDNKFRNDQITENYQRFYESDSKKTTLDGGVRDLSSPLFDDGSVSFRYEKHEETSGNYENQFSFAVNLRDAEIELTKIDSNFSKYFTFLDQKVNYGLSFQQEKMIQDKRSGTREIEKDSADNYEFYIQDSILFSERHELMIGGRIQHDSGFGEHATVKLNWLYSNGPLRLRTTLATGYRAPSLKERFYRFDHSNLGYMVLGNKELNPEKSERLSATLSYVMERSSVDISVYHNQYRDKIDTLSKGASSDNPGVVIYEYTNYAKAYTRGIDLSHILESDFLFMQNSLSLLDTKDEESGRRLQDQPRWSFKTQLTANFTDSFSASLFGVVEYDRYNGLYDSDGDDNDDRFSTAVTDTVQTWDIRFNLQLMKQLGLYGAVENILNETKKSPIAEDGSEFDERSIEPRLYRVGVNLKF